MTQEIKILIVGILVIGVCGFLFWFFSIHKTKVSTDTTTDNTDIGDVSIPGTEREIGKIQYSSAKEDRFSGEYDSAIQKLDKIIKNATDTEQIGLSKIFKAESLYERAQGDDIAQSVALYKEIIGDQTMSSRVKAAALNGVASIVVNNDSAFYKTYFFDAPFKDLYQDGADKKRAVQDTYLKILEWSDKVSPNSYAKYAIAGDYYATLLFNGQIKAEDTNRTAQKMIQYVADADALNDEVLYSPVAVLVRNLYRALALSVGGKELQQTPEEREDGFKSAYARVVEVENFNNDQSTKFHGMKLRFYYANFLVGSFGEERNESIRVLLKSFGSIDSTENLLQARLKDFFIARKDPQRSIYARITQLGNVSPEFNKYLISIGFF